MLLYFYSALQFYDEQIAAYQIPDFWSKHLLVLEVLSFQTINMTLNFKRNICDGWSSG